jgi:hypothetical protein
MDYMKALGVAVSAVLFAWNMVGLAQSTASCGQVIDAPLRPAATLSIDSIAAGIEIVGTDHNTVHVSCSADDKESARHVRIQLTETPAGAKLKLKGPRLKHGNLTVRIEVPRQTNLGLNMGAGEVKIGNVVGDKNLSLRAGAITVSSNHLPNYKDVNASVSIGEVDVSPDGVAKGGFLRDFRKQNPNGQYRLNAHVITGKIVLIGMNTLGSVGPD